VPHRFPHMANGAPDDLGTSKLTSSKPGHRSEELVDEFSGIDDKFSGIDDKFSGIDDKFSGIDDKFSGIDDKFSGIDTVPV
jgi:archaellum component FlaC